jgi:hypothetical protein
LAEPKLEDILPTGVRAELEAKHGEILAVRTKAGPAAFIGPTRAQYKRHLAVIGEDKTRGERIEEFVTALCVWPDKTQFSGMLDKKPGIALTVYGAITSFAGLEDEKTTKKYETGAEET